MQSIAIAAVRRVPQLMLGAISSNLPITAFCRSLTFRRPTEMSALALPRLMDGKQIGVKRDPGQRTSVSEIDLIIAPKLVCSGRRKNLVRMV